MGVPVPCVDGHLVVGGNAGGAQFGRGRIDVVDEEADGPTVAARGAGPIGGADREGRVPVHPFPGPRRPRLRAGGAGPAAGLVVATAKTRRSDRLSFDPRIIAGSR